MWNGRPKKIPAKVHKGFASIEDVAFVAVFPFGNITV